MSHNTYSTPCDQDAIASEKTLTQEKCQPKTNAFLIRPGKGAIKGVKAGKDSLKAEGCHWYSPASAWSCPISSKPRISELLQSSKLSFDMLPLFDEYFEKSASAKDAENTWTQVDILDKKYHAESSRLIVENATLDNEIAGRQLSQDDPAIAEQKKHLEERHQKQNVLAEEIEQLRISAKLLEETKDQTTPLPFRILGHNAKKEILIWQNGRLIALAAGRLNKDELRLLVGGKSQWFQIPDGDRLLKNRLIDEAREKGFIDDEAPLKAGVWNLKGKWVVISGKRAATIVNGDVKYLEEPIFEGKLIETCSSSWLDWEVFGATLKTGLDGLKTNFNLLYEKTRLWNWLEPSMAVYAAAFLMLAIAQQAMSWRPWIYLTGAKGTGKSTFFEFLLQMIFGSLVERLDKSTAHATAQTIGNSGRIAIFDEFEKHRHIPEILELAKLFNKGGQKTSGTGSENAYRYQLHHMPWFGSIYLPKRLMQDAAQESRIIKLELRKLKEGTPLLEKFDSHEAPKISAGIAASLITCWEKIEAKAQEINADRNKIMQATPGIEIRTVENFMYASALVSLVAPELIDQVIPSWSVVQSEDDGDKILVSNSIN